MTTDKTLGAIVLVPREPTLEMITAFWGEITHGEPEIAAAKEAYAEMIAAAPADPIEDARAMVEQTPAVGGEPIKRYDMSGFGDGMIEVEGGAFAYFDDVDPLLADLASANADKQAYGQNAIDLRKRLTKAQARIADLEALCGELYQVLGALDAPAQVLDKVYAASNGDAIPSGDLLPFVPEPPAKIDMPDHKLREAVNELRDLAKTYGQTEQLRDRCADWLRKLNRL